MTNSAVLSKKDNCIQSAFWHECHLRCDPQTHCHKGEFQILFLDFLSLFISLSFVFNLFLFTFIFSVCSHLSCSLHFAKCFPATFPAFNEEDSAIGRKMELLLKHHTAHSTRATLWSERERRGQMNRKSETKRRLTWEKGGRQKKKQHHLQTYEEMKREVKIGCKRNSKYCRKMSETLSTWAKKKLIRVEIEWAWEKRPWGGINLLHLLISYSQGLGGA